jgi:hypothetical protein
MYRNSNLEMNGTMTNEKTGKVTSQVKNSPEKAIANEALDNLISEGGENFFNYVSRLGLVNDPNMVVLSSNHHYYYDYNELKDVTTVINMKKLNMIKHLDSFLSSVCNVISPKTNFIGCFAEGKNRNIGLSTRIYRNLINFLDSKTDRDIERQDVYKLMALQGYRVMDMTEINGITYFRTQYQG